MGKISLLDCTLRDGGYVNDWQFGREAIHGIGPKLAKSGIEIFEAGFIKGTTYDPDRAVYPDVRSMADAIAPKLPELMYVGMVDMSDPVSLDCLVPKREDSADGLRVPDGAGKPGTGRTETGAVCEYPPRRAVPAPPDFGI